MKIGVIAATGRVGTLVMKEALDRGHRVTAIVRNKSKVTDPRPEVLEKDIFSLTSQDLKDFDVVVSAFGPPPGKGNEIQLQDAMRVLVNAMESLPSVRLIMVGGAASLYADPEGKTRVLESIPQEYRGVPANAMIAFEDILKKSRVNWTYFSPAAFFDPEGPRTASYRLGGDYMILNDEGASYLSYADYAIALVDEIENKAHVGRRFTAVSNKNGTPIQNSSRKEKPKVEFEGASQYRGPMVYELAGRSFYLVMDDGREGLLSFVTGESLLWSPRGESPTCQRYDCLKADEDTYLINLEVAGAEPRTGVTLVLDRAQSLVTAVIARQGVNRRYPDMVTNEVIFGAVKQPGMALPRKRHGFTGDLNGLRITWRYSPEVGMTHVYYCSSYIRAAFPGQNTIVADPAGEHPYDENCTYVKIKEHIYLVSFLENNMTIQGGIGNNMLILINTARLHDVGRSFGLHRDRTPENYMFSAIGSWTESDGGIESAPSKYRV